MRSRSSCATRARAAAARFARSAAFALACARLVRVVVPEAPGFTDDVVLAGAAVIFGVGFGAVFDVEVDCPQAWLGPTNSRAAVAAIPIRAINLRTCTAPPKIEISTPTAARPKRCAIVAPQLLRPQWVAAVFDSPFPCAPQANAA